MTIIKKSIGKSATNTGEQKEIIEDKFEINLNRKCHIIDVVPIGAVRMSNSDRWKTNPNHHDVRKRQRPAVTRYFDFKNKVVRECNKVGYLMKENIEVVFFIPMPDSWSSKKKEKMNGKPHKSRPDLDNIVKGFMDSLREQDGDIWSIKAEKRYAYKGSILIYE